jgi:hypothetical protein
MVVSSHKPKPKNVGFFTQTKTQKCLSLRTSQNPKMLVSSHKPKPKNVGFFAQAKTQKCWSLLTIQRPKMLVNSYLYGFFFSVKIHLSLMSSSQS